MINHPQKILFGGLVIGVLGVASYLLQSGKDEFPGSQPGVGHSGPSVFGALDNRPITTPRIDLDSIDPTSNTSVAQVLQAVHDSLQRNDLASAKVLLDAVRTYRKGDKDDERTRSLQRELQVREGATDSVPNPAPAEQSSAATNTQGVPNRSGTSRSVDTPRRLHPQGSGKSAIARRDVMSEPMPPIIAANPGTSRTERAPVVINIYPAETSHELPSMTAAAPPSDPAPVAVVPETPQVGITKTAAVPAAPAPKTRAEVRAELERARTDGSLPRFGNPDPAGPGIATISSIPAPQQ